MSELAEKISKLDDVDVLRLALWLFDSEREAYGGELADASLESLADAHIEANSKRLLQEHGIEQFDVKPNPANAVAGFRQLLLAYTRQEPAKTQENMRGLGMEAGTNDILNFFSENYPFLLIALTLLRPIKFKTTKVKTEKGFKWEISIESGSPVEALKQLAGLAKLFKADAQ